MAHTERSLLARFLFWYGGRPPPRGGPVCLFFPKAEKIKKKKS